MKINIIVTIWCRHHRPNWPIGHCLNDYIFVFVHDVRIRGTSANMTRFHSGTFPIHHKPREIQITMVTLHGWWLISWSWFLVELAPGCHLLPGSRWGGRWSTIQLAEGGNPFLPPNSGHLPPSRRWRWRLVVMKHSQGFSRSFSFFYRNFLLRLLSSWGKFFLQKLFSPSCISSQC